MPLPSRVGSCRPAGGALPPAAALVRARGGDRGVRHQHGQDREVRALPLPSSQAPQPRRRLPPTWGAKAKSLSVTASRRGYLLALVAALVAFGALFGIGRASGSEQGPSRPAAAPVLVDAPVGGALGAPRLGAAAPLPRPAPSPRPVPGAVADEGTAASGPAPSSPAPTPAAPSSPSPPPALAGGAVSGAFPGAGPRPEPNPAGPPA